MCIEDSLFKKKFIVPVCAIGSLSNMLLGSDISPKAELKSAGGTSPDLYFSVGRRRKNLV